MSHGFGRTSSGRLWGVCFLSRRWTQPLDHCSRLNSRRPANDVSGPFLFAQRSWRRCLTATLPRPSVPWVTRRNGGGCMTNHCFQKFSSHGTPFRIVPRFPDFRYFSAPSQVFCDGNAQHFEKRTRLSHQRRYIYIARFDQLLARFRRCGVGPVKCCRTFPRLQTDSRWRANRRQSIRDRESLPLRCQFLQTGCVKVFPF